MPSRRSPPPLRFLRVSYALSVVGDVGLSTHFTPPSLLFSSLTSSLFEEALVEEMGATGESRVLQTEEQVPEIDTRDALPCGPEARRTSPTR